MKIVHISLSGSYTDGWSYHENELPYWHKKLGNDVSLIVRNRLHDGIKIIECPEQIYFNKQNIKVYRIKIKERLINSWSAPKRQTINSILSSEKPNLIWVHGSMDFTLPMVVRYKKIYSPSTIICADNHCDDSNYKEDVLRRINLKIISKRLKKILPYIDAFYGVTPGRCLFLKDKLQIPEQKIILSIQGGNPDEIDFRNKAKINFDFRLKYHIGLGDFIYTIGGKLTHDKKLFPLINEFKKTCSKNIKLVIFGDIPDTDFDLFQKEISSDNRIIYLGFLNATEISEVFLSTNACIFPGRHSVLWEKALSCGVPCLFEQKDGYEHLFSGGAIKINDITKASININLDTFPLSSQYKEAELNAIKNRQFYLYDYIARQSIVKWIK